MSISEVIFAVVLLCYVAFEIFLFKILFSGGNSSSEAIVEGGDKISTTSTIGSKDILFSGEGELCENVNDFVLAKNENTMQVGEYGKYQATMSLLAEKGVFLRSFNSNDKDTKTYRVEFANNIAELVSMKDASRERIFDFEWQNEGKWIALNISERLEQFIVVSFNSLILDCGNNFTVEHTGDLKDGSEVITLREASDTSLSVSFTLGQYVANPSKTYREALMKIYSHPLIQYSEHQEDLAITVRKVGRKVLNRKQFGWYLHSFYNSSFKIWKKKYNLEHYLNLLEDEPVDNLLNRLREAIKEEKDLDKIILFIEDDHLMLYPDYKAFYLHETSYSRSNEELKIGFCYQVVNIVWGENLCQGIIAKIEDFLAQEKENRWKESGLTSKLELN